MDTRACATNLDLHRCIEFLNEIGLPTWIEIGASGFTKGVDIRRGELYVDPEAASPSGLLREAGRLAITPGEYRHLMDGDVQGGQAKMLAMVNQMGVVIDSPLYRAVIQNSDPEATAWAWAAGTHLGLRGDVIINDCDQQGEGAIVRMQVSNNTYLGINGLSHAGFCVTRKHLSPIRKLPVFPMLAYWLQPSGLSPVLALGACR